MKKLNSLLALPLAGILLLTACSGGSETPYLNTASNSASPTSNAVKTPPTAPAIAETPKATGDNPASTDTPVSDQPVNSETTIPVDANNPLNKGPEPEPYVDHSKEYAEKAGVLQPGQAPVPAANADNPPKESGAPDITLDAATLNTLKSTLETYKASVIAGEWDNACSHVSIASDKTLADCVEYLSTAGTYHQEGFDLADGSASVNASTKVLTVQKKIGTDMSTERIQFIQDEGTGQWKMFIAALA